MSGFDESRSRAQSFTLQTLVESYVEAAREADVPAFSRLAQSLTHYDAAAWTCCAELLMHRNLSHQAVALLNVAREQWPTDVEIQFALGAALRLSGNGVSAEKMLRRVLDGTPEHERASLTLALLYRDRGQNNAAAKLIVGLHRRLGSIESTLYLADLLRQCRREHEAMELCEAQLRTTPDQGRLQFTAGGLALTLGRFDRARSLLLSALDQPVPELDALMPLALTRKYTDPADPDIPRFERALKAGFLPVNVRSAAGFALAKALDDLGDYAGASIALRAANGLKYQMVKWSAQAWRDFVNQLINSIPPAPLGSPITDEFVPIFVVGLPRTGTTLIAELLGRCHEVKSRGELPWLSMVAAKLAQGSTELDRDALRQSAAFYLTHLSQDDERARWYVDKNPLNFRYLGLIAALFPNAKIIVCERDRRDTALSLWSQSFDSEETGFAHNFDDIERFAEGYDRLMAHWQPQLGNMLIRIDYERLVRQPDGVLAEIQSFVGLPPVALTHAEPRTASAVNTASVWQVRQPIYQSSIGRAEAYAALIPELVRFPVGRRG